MSVGSVAVAVPLALTLQACGSNSPTSPSGTGRGAPLARVELVAPRTLAPGASTQLQFSGTLANGSTVNLTTQASWRSSQSSVVTVDPGGRATAHGAGESTITATSDQRSSTKEIIVVPSGTYRLSVLVTENGSTVPGVRVEVVGGIGRGLSDDSPVGGRYDLYGVAGSATLKVAGGGYLDRLEPVVVNDHMLVAVEMTPAEPRSDISGPYTLTVVADPTCRTALPATLGVRTYGADVTQAGPEVRVALSGATFSVKQQRGNRFVGRMNASNTGIAFNLGGFGRDYYDADFHPDVIEHLSGLGAPYFVLSGVADVTVSRTVLSGRLDGALQLVDVGFYGSWFLRAECQSSAHSFVLTR